MNTDKDEKDAKFVMEKMELKYPTLKGKGLPQRFGVRIPDLIIIVIKARFTTSMSDTRQPCAKKSPNKFGSF